VRTGGKALPHVEVVQIEKPVRLVSARVRHVPIRRCWAGAVMNHANIRLAPALQKDTE
jgi:hypothetical protein